MKTNWLWDSKLKISEAKKILKNPSHREFTTIASLLFLRNNEPKAVFKDYIDPLLFCKHWAKIKKRMRKDKWNSQRIVFWQAIYEELLKKYQQKGIAFRKEKQEIRSDFCKEVGEQIRNIRKEQGLSQKSLAQKLKVSQQLISRIESGKENISLINLKSILKVLGRKVKIIFY